MCDTGQYGKYYSRFSIKIDGSVSIHTAINFITLLKLLQKQPEIPKKDFQIVVLVRHSICRSSGPANEPVLIRAKGARIRSRREEAIIRSHIDR